MGRFRILMIDQNSTESRFLIEKLESREFGISLVRDTTEAFNQLIHELPDVILLTTTGKESLPFCRLVRKYSDLPLVIFCDSHQNNVELDYLEAGADDYFIKPFSLDVLALKLKALIRRSNTSALSITRLREPNMSIK
jgi:DNA-binding response OmpR family regulator